MTAIELHPDDVENLEESKKPTHPAGTVTAFDEETGLPIVRRHVEQSPARNSSNHVEKPEVGTKYKEVANEKPSHASPFRVSEDDHPRKTGAEAPRPHDSKSMGGRDVLHQSADRAELVRHAKEHARQFEDGLKGATRGIAGAKFDAVRGEKNPLRLDEKIKEEGQPVETVPDLLAGRLSADSHGAHEKLAASVGQHFKVVRDEDEFKDGDPEFGYRVHKMQVQVTPQLSAEVHIVPKEVLEVNDKEHKAYKEARDAEQDGDPADKKAATAKAKKINDAAMKRFEERNAETKFKFGSTQANLPVKSDAHRSIKAAQALIDDDDLAGDGKDVDDPHVTVRYGLKGDDNEGVRKYLGAQVPFQAKLGKTAAFPPSAHSDGAAVIMAPVESDDLHRMNTEIEKHGNFAPSSFKEYKPHVSIAYVKPEAAARYTGMDVTHGKSFPVSEIHISNEDGEKESVRLGGKMPAEASHGKLADDSAKHNSGGAGNRSDTGAAGVSRFAGRRQDGSAGAIHRNGLGKPGTNERPDRGTSGSERNAMASEAPAKLSKGQTVLVGDSHGIVRGGNPNFSSGGRWSVETPDGTETFRGSQLQPIERAKPKPETPWDGVDLDKTLAHDDGWKGPNHIGKPLPAMVDRVKKMLADGKQVRIFTARVADDPKGIARAAIEAWSHRHIGQVLPVTHEKDRWMASLFDDRAHAVEPNTGKVLA